MEVSRCVGRGGDEEENERTKWCEGDLLRGLNLCERHETSEMIGRRIVKFESVVFFSLFISFVTQARA